MKFARLYKSRAAVALALVFALSTLVATAAFAQGKQDFTLHNMTGVEIHELYVSPHSSDDWEEDVLGQDTLADGDSVDIHFSPKETARLWD